MDPLLKTKEVAALLNVSVRTLTYWRKIDGAGPRPFCRFGDHTVRYPRESVERFIAGQAGEIHDGD